MNIDLKLLLILVLIVFISKSYSRQPEPKSVDRKASYLIPSIFDKFPPYLRFPPLNQCQHIPPEIKKFLYWPKEYYRSKQIVTQTTKCAGINILSRRDLRNCTEVIRNGKMLGSYISYCTKPAYEHTHQNFTKIRNLPKISLLDNKSKLRVLFYRLEKRLKIKLPWLIQSYNLPSEMKIFRWAWERGDNKYWVSKPPNGVVAKGIKIISHWKQLPKRKKLSVQKYIHNPYLYNGKKVELRSWYLITGFNPLRIYHLSQFDRFKQQFTNFTMDPKSFENRCIHIRSRRFPECGWRQDPEYCRSTIGNIFDSMEECGGNVRLIYDQLHSIVITTLLELENQILEENYSHRYGNYIVLSFDCFVDDNFKLWLNEVNWRPGVFPIPKFYKNFGQIFNILGINFPPTISPAAQSILRSELKSVVKGESKHKMIDTIPMVYYNYHAIDKETTITYKEFKSFDDLSNSEIRQLAILEDELSRVKKYFAKRIFPTDTIQQYFPIIKSDHQNVYRVLEKWEKAHKFSRRSGRKYLNERLNNDTSLVF